MGSLLSQLFTGLGIGATLLLIALGLTFTFGQMNVINMAHGEFIMAGAYTAYLLQGSFGRETSLLVSLPVAFVIAGALGVALETVLIRRMYGRPLDTLLVTWGVSLMLQQLARDLFGAANVQVLSPSWLGGGVHVAGVDMPYARLFIMALVAAAVAGIWVYMTYLPQGRRMRAVMQNRQLAACSGIPTARVDRRTFERWFMRVGLPSPRHFLAAATRATVDATREDDGKIAPAVSVEITRERCRIRRARPVGAGRGLR